jgi:predicted secreted protein
MNGNNILIYMNGSAIAGTKSNDVQTECDTIEISSPSIGDWRTFMAGRKSWSVQTSFLVTATSSVRQLLNVGTSYTLVIRDRSGSNSVSGTAILTSCRISAIRGNLATGQFAFTGSGALA